MNKKIEAAAREIIADSLAVTDDAKGRVICDQALLLKNIAAALSALPPLRAREEIAGIIVQKFLGVTEYPTPEWQKSCLDVADAILSSAAGQEWRDISSMPDRMKVGTVWKTSDDKIFATLESRWQIDLPAPPVAEPLLADNVSRETLASNPDAPVVSRS